MDEPSRPSVWRAGWLLVMFDLRTLLSTPSIWITTFVVPLMLLLMVLVVVGTPATMVSSSEMGLTDARILVVVEDPSDHESLVTGFAKRGTVEVVAKPPRDLDVLLASGEVGLVGWPRPSFMQDGAIRIERGSGSLSAHASKLREDLKRWLLERRAQAVAGELGPISMERLDGSFVDLQEGGPAGSSALAPLKKLLPNGMVPKRTTSHAMGVFAIGLIGLMVGLLIGSSVSESSRRGFNHVLALGTPPVAVFASELVVGAVFTGVQSIGWWMVYGVGSAVLGGVAEVDVETTGELAKVAPLMILLAIVAFVTMASVSIVISRLSEDLPRAMRERGLRAISFPLMIFVVVGSQMAGMETTAWFAWLPAVGAVAVWTLYVEQVGSVWGLVLLQMAYAGIAFWVGAKMYVYSESPWSVWRRRWTVGTSVR